MSFHGKAPVAWTADEWDEYRAELRVRPKLSPARWFRLLRAHAVQAGCSRGFPR